MPQAKQNDDGVTQEKLLKITQKFHEDAIKLMSSEFVDHMKSIGETPTNSMQFAAVDGVAAAIANIIASVALDASLNPKIGEQEALSSGYEIVCVLQKTISHTYKIILGKALQDIDDVDKLCADFEKDFLKKYPKS